VLGCLIDYANYSFTERSAAREKRPGESVKLRSGKMDSVAVLTLTRMTMTCNYNVQFPFRFWGNLSCPFSMVTM
jgi:hypothetical protein